MTRPEADRLLGSASFHSRPATERALLTLILGRGRLGAYRATRRMLARWLGVCVRTISRAARDLERDGLLWRRQGSGRAATLWLPITTIDADLDDALDELADLHFAALADAQTGRQCHPSIATSDPSTGRQCHPSTAAAEAELVVQADARETATGSECHPSIATSDARFDSTSTPEGGCPCHPSTPRPGDAPSLVSSPSGKMNNIPRARDARDPGARPAAPPSVVVDLEDPGIFERFRRLRAAGVWRRAAERLARACSREAIEAGLAYVARKRPRNPAGFLAAYLRGGWTETDELLAARRRAEDQRRRALEATERRRAEEAERLARLEVERLRVDQVLASHDGHEIRRALEELRRRDLATGGAFARLQWRGPLDRHLARNRARVAEVLSKRRANNIAAARSAECTWFEARECGAKTSGAT